MWSCYISFLNVIDSITTASQLNGALVLRHELGHSIIEGNPLHMASSPLLTQCTEGEEYDGGYVYEGPNAADSLDVPFKWQHWLTSPSIPPRAERSMVPLQAYPWTMLSPSKPYTASFDSAGTYSSYLIKFSLSGIPNKEDLRVELDGKDIGWTPQPGVGLDRWHYDIHSPEGVKLDGGQHEIAFYLGPNANSKIAQLCSVEIVEYGDETEYAFPFSPFCCLNEVFFQVQLL